MFVVDKALVTHRWVRLRLRPTIAIKRPFLPTKNGIADNADWSGLARIF